MESEPSLEKAPHIPRSENRERIFSETERNPEVDPRGKISETEEIRPSSGYLQHDLQLNYTDHLKSLEKASMNMLDGVIKSARQGFYVSLVLNICTFLLGMSIIIVGLIALFQAPEAFGRVIGVVSSLAGLVLVISLIFWKGPLERILGSVSNLAQINAISLGLAHRLNQVARVFVQKSIDGDLDTEMLQELNSLVAKSVSDSIKSFEQILPKEAAEKQTQKFISKSGIFEKKS